MAAQAAVTATPTAVHTLPRFSNFPPVSSDSLPVLFSSSPSRSVPFAASDIPSAVPSSAASFCRSSFSMPFRAACALFSWICHAWVRRSFSPNEEAAFWSADRRTSIFCFCASICFPRTRLRSVRASVEVSFLSNCESTSFISEPRTLKDWLISDRERLNSFSPSSPIFSPNLLSAIPVTSFAAIKKPGNPEHKESTGRFDRCLEI